MKVVDVYFAPPKRLSRLPDARLLGVAFVKDDINGVKKTISLELRVMKRNLAEGALYTLRLHMEDTYEAKYVYEVFKGLLGKGTGLYKGPPFLYSEWEIMGEEAWSSILERMPKVQGPEWKEALSK